MPESRKRKPKPAADNRRDVAKNYAKNKAEKEEAVDLIMEGLTIRVEDTPAGQRVTYDMDHLTHDAITAFAESQGITLDDVLRANIRRTVGKVTGLRRKAQKDQNAADLLRVQSEHTRAVAELDALRADAAKE